LLHGATESRPCPSILPTVGRSAKPNSGHAAAAHAEFKPSLHCGNSGLHCKMKPLVRTAAQFAHLLRTRGAPTHDRGRLFASGTHRAVHSAAISRGTLDEARPLRPGRP